MKKKAPRSTTKRAARRRYTHSARQKDKRQLAGAQAILAGMLSTPNPNDLLVQDIDGFLVPDMSNPLA